MIHMDSSAQLERIAPGTESLDVAVVDPSPTQRQGTELVLRSWGHHVVGRAGSFESGFEMIRSRRPQLALVDMDLPGDSGAELVRRALGLDWELGIVLLLGHASTAELEEAAGCGARGVVLKSGEVDELSSAVRIVGAGGRYIGPSVEARAHALSRSRVLSNREREVLQLLAGGLTGAQAAIQLAISPETVRTHVRNAMRKLRARTRVHAVTIAVRRQEIWS